MLHKYGKPQLCCRCAEMYTWRELNEIFIDGRAVGNTPNYAEKPQGPPKFVCFECLYPSDGLWSKTTTDYEYCVLKYKNDINSFNYYTPETIKFINSECNYCCLLIQQIRSTKNFFDAENKCDLLNRKFMHLRQKYSPDFRPREYQVLFSKDY